MKKFVASISFLSMLAAFPVLASAQVPVKAGKAAGGVVKAGTTGVAAAGKTATQAANAAKAAQTAKIAGQVSAQKTGTASVKVAGQPGKTVTVKTYGVSPVSPSVTPSAAAHQAVATPSVAAKVNMPKAAKIKPVVVTKERFNEVISNWLESGEYAKVPASTFNGGLTVERWSPMEKKGASFTTVPGTAPIYRKTAAGEELVYGNQLHQREVISDEYFKAVPTGKLQNMTPADRILNQVPSELRYGTRSISLSHAQQLYTIYSDLLSITASNVKEVYASADAWQLAMKVITDSSIFGSVAQNAEDVYKIVAGATEKAAPATDYVFINWALSMGPEATETVNKVMRLRAAQQKWGTLEEGPDSSRPVFDLMNTTIRDLGNPAAFPQIAEGFALPGVYDWKTFLDYADRISWGDPEMENYFKLLGSVCPMRHLIWDSIEMQKQRLTEKQSILNGLFVD